MPTPPADRYARQVLLPDFGPAGQRALAASHAAIVGLGALGCAAADLLCRAGVGTLTLIDRDTVDLTNLQRQTLYCQADAEARIPKAEAAAARLAEINPEVRLIVRACDLSHSNAEAVLSIGQAERPPDVLMDGTDNFEARYLLNDVSVAHAIAYCYAGVVGTRGMQATFVPGKGPCLRCVFETPPAPGTSPTCDTAGVLNAAVAIAAGAQVADAMKVLVGRGDLLGGTLLDFDLWSNQRRRLDLRTLGPRADCPCCGERRFEFLSGLRGAAGVVLCGQDAVQVVSGDRGSRSIDLDALAERLGRIGPVWRSRFMVRVELPEKEGGVVIEVSVFADGRAIVRGTTRPELARSIVARYVGA